MLQLFGGPARPRPDDPDRLLQVIRSVRRRWRLRLALRGLAISGAVALAAFLVASFALEQLRFAPTAVLALRLACYAIVLAVVGWYLVRPLARRVTDEQVALYLEEHEPGLNGQVSSAVEFGAHGERADPSTSWTLVHRLIERAIESCAAIGGGRRVEQPRLTRLSGALTGVVLAGALVLLLQPGFISHGAPFLLTPWATDAASPFAIDVEPGDVELPRGADLRVVARLRNFGADEVTLMVRSGPDGEWERWPMSDAAGSGTFEFLVFNVTEDAEYLVEAAGVRSVVFRVSVRDLPYVDRIDLEYEFPAYTGLSPQRQENSGDIAAIAGTRVVLSVLPTMDVAGGALVIDDRDTVPLAAGDGRGLLGELRLTEPGYYRVLLRGVGGTTVVASPDYVIDVLADQPPSVTFVTPGRDVSVTMVDEVFVELRAEDDYGLRSAELVYALNGGPERTVALYDGSGRRSQITAGHTFYLEEYELRPGDFLSYYARVSDGNGIGGPQRAATDIYFMDIRAFDRRYRQAESSGEEGAGGEANVGELSARQRQIVAATFKLVRDSTDYARDELLENLTTLALAQGRLREEVETLVNRMKERGVAAMDSTMRTIAEALPRAVEAMGEAEQRLGERRAQDALSPEQVALQFLQRAEAAFRERQISRQQGGGQGGGEQSASAEELADLFELEMDKLRNQYERVDRGEQRQADQQVDELLERLRELARRQEQENERMRARARQEDAGGGGGDAQRRLAEEAEETARQLERLSREQSRPELQETARRLREAAEAMRRAAAGESGEGAARGQAALDQLREARRQLQRDRSAGLERDVQDALERAERLADEQAGVMRDVERLGQDPTVAQERSGRLVERKNEMATELQDLERQLTELARDARADQPEAAEKLQGAAREMRDTRLRDKVLYSRGLLQQGGSPDYQRNFEEQIGTDLENLEQGIRDALGAFGESRDQRLERSLERTRDLVSALESLDERMRANAEGEANRPGSEERPSPQGQPGGVPRGGGAGQLSPDEARQYRQELGRRRAELSELRRELSEEGLDVGTLDEILGDLRNLESPGRLEDPRTLAQLQDAVIAGLKEFEFALRRQLGSERTAEGAAVGTDEVPPRYRELVEEYYRSLSRIRR
jgi:hypothetical protein